MSMLVEIAYKTEGFVKDCPTVLRASKKKREENDYLAAFVKDNVRRSKEGKIVKKSELMETFKTWYQANYPGTKTIPKAKEVVDYMNLKFGECVKAGWRNTEIIYEDEDEEED